MKRAVLTWPLLAVVALLFETTSVPAAPIFFGPLPYLSAASIPSGFYAGGGPVALEDFEDSTLGFGITASGGSVIPPYPTSGVIDSVDGDNGPIDGSGLSGHSWFVSSGNTGIKFTFAGPTYPTAAGMVWTDGVANGSVTFRAYGPGGTLLGTWGSFILGDGSYAGGTAEDRFFGVLNQGGISAIELIEAPGGSNAGMEVDHVQFGVAVPEPGTLALLGIGLVGIARAARRRR